MLGMNVSTESFSSYTSSSLATIDDNNNEVDCGMEDDDDTSEDLEMGLMVDIQLREEERFRKTCFFVARFGLAASQYGATSSRVELFLQNLMKGLFYSGIFRISNTDIFCVCQRSPDSEQVIQMIELEQGVNLYRLGLLNDVAKELLQGTINQADAVARMDAIAKEPDPWGLWAVFLCFILTGTCAPAIFQGNWCDLLGGCLCSFPVYALTMKLPPLYRKALPLLSSFSSSIVAIALQKLLIPQLQVSLVVLSSVIMHVPGYSASLAVSEILSDHIISGIGRLVNSMVELALLVGGYWLGTNILNEWEGRFPTPAEFEDAGQKGAVAIPFIWQAVFFIPILMFCLCVLFQCSRQDFFWSFLNLIIAYLSSLAATAFSGKGNVGVFLGAVSVTAYAQAWARWKDRPRSLVIVPALVLLVSGSIGFRGLISWTMEGERETGLKEFAQMFIVALLIMAGILVGDVLVRSNTTL